MDVTLPNGNVIKDVPDNATKAQIKAKAISAGLAKEADFPSFGANPNMVPFSSGSEEDIVQKELKQYQPEKSFLDKAAPYAQTAIESLAAIPIMAGAGAGLSALSKGTKAAPYVADFARSVMPQTGRALAAESALAVGTGVAAQAAGEQVEEGAMRDIVSTATGLGIGAAAGWAQTAKEAYKKSFSSSATETALEASTALGRDKASSLARTALKANPTLASTLNRAFEIEAKTGISLPTLAASNGDTTISQFLQSQIARGENAEFTAGLKLTYEAAEKQLAKAQKGAAPSMEAVDYFVKQKAKLQAKANQAKLDKQAKLYKSRQEGLNKIDNALANLANNFPSTSNEQIGRVAQSLLESRAKSIRADFAPRYDELLSKAKEAGLTLKGDAARDLRVFATTKQNEDIFSRFPSLYGQLQSVFKPTQQSASSSFLSKYKTAKVPTESKDFSIDTLDSLKRNVNKAINSSKDPDQLRVLGALKKEVNKAIESVDPTFAAAYRQIDKEYAQKLGMPFSEEGVMKINRAKFVEDVVPMLTKQPSAIKQIVAAAGDSPEMYKVVEDAFLMDIANNKSIINTATGQINPNQLQRYLNQNRAKIELVPGLEQRLSKIASSAQLLSQNRGAILEAQKKAATKEVEDLWTSAYGSREGLAGLVERSVNTPADLDKLVELSKDSVPAQGAIKAALLDNMLTKKASPTEYLTENRNVFVKFYGKEGTDNLQYIAEASERLKNNPFTLRLNLNSAQKSEWERATGSNVSTSLGEARNQVLSTARKVINHASRFFQNRATNTENAEIQKFLSDPKIIQETAQLMQELDTKGMTSKAFDILKGFAARQSGRYLLGSALGYNAGQNAQNIEQPYELEDESLLEGFGQ